MASVSTILLIALICIFGLCAVSYGQDVSHQDAQARRFDFDQFSSADVTDDDQVEDEDQDEVPTANEEVRHFPFDFFAENEEDADDSDNQNDDQVDLSSARRFDFDHFEENDSDADQDDDEEERKRHVRDASDDDAARRFSFEEFEENDQDSDDAEVEHVKPLQFDEFEDATEVSELTTSADEAQAPQKRSVPANPAESPRSRFSFRKLW